MLDAVGQMPYQVRQSAFDAAPALSRYTHITGLLYQDLPDEAASEIARWTAAPPTPLSTSHVYPLDGAAGRVDRRATAWPWREAAFAQMVVAAAPAPGAETRLESWAEGAHEALRPWALPGGYSNFQMDRGPRSARTCYGMHAPRLESLKRRCDPQNLFRRNQNILAAE